MGFDDEEEYTPRVVGERKPHPRFCTAGHSSFRLDCPACAEKIRQDLMAKDSRLVPTESGIMVPVKKVSTSESRFHDRIERFRKNERPVSVHHFWWFVHNAIAHPFIAVLPFKFFFDFHDYTSRKINGK